MGRRTCAGRKGSHPVSDFLPTDSANVMIGVCGEQGSGKTVFLTCIFQSIWNAVPDDLTLDFERKEIGNASYFQSIEDGLIARGPAQGTTERSLFPARFFVKPYGAAPGITPPVLSVDLLDFAGRHFRSMADLKSALTGGDADSDDLKALSKVNETLERADAFVILINSQEIDPINETPRRYPFSPSVNFMLTHCRQERKPVALLFSQIDQTPRLTEDLLHDMPRVQEFQRKFTRDLKETVRGGRPFGVVQRISCYETVPGDLAPRRQTPEGSIWRPEPAEVVLELLRAAMPRINERLAREAAAIEEARREKEDAERRRRRRKRTYWIAALLAALLLLALLALAYSRRTEAAQLRLLNDAAAAMSSGNLAAISPDAARLGAILTAARAAPDGAVSTLRAAVEHLESVFGEEGQRLAAAPALDPAYRGNLGRFEDLLPLFDPAVSGPWRQTFLPVLQARSDFLSDWFGTVRKERRTRTQVLDEAANRFRAGRDSPFSAVLAAAATRERETEVASWQARIDADGDVPSRLATIQSLLASATAEQDAELLRLARRALAGQLAETILKRQENRLLRDKLLTPLAPDLAKLGDGDIRFEVLAREVAACKSDEDCDSRQGVLRAVLTEAAAGVASWSAAVENALRSLLLDVPPAARRKVWQGLSEGLARAYLFSLREDAWPSGLRPLPELALPPPDVPGDFTEDLIERIAQHPVYEGELGYLGDRIMAAGASRKVVPIYANLLSALAESSSALQTEGLTMVGDQVSSTLADCPETSGPLADLQSEIANILVLVQSVNDRRQGGSLGDPADAIRLERLLEDAKRGHCTALESQAAPKECANAA
jgi:hypothetical protein